MWWAYVEPSPPRFRRNGKTCLSTTSNISFGSKCLNRDQRRSSYDRFPASLPSGNVRRSIGLFVRLALFSSSVCRSSNRLINSKYVICSITSSGLEMPPFQNESQILSTLLLISPVISRDSLAVRRPVVNLVVRRCSGTYPTGRVETIASVRRPATHCSRPLLGHTLHSRRMHLTRERPRKRRQTHETLPGTPHEPGRRAELRLPEVRLLALCGLSIAWRFPILNRIRARQGS